jgi:hypothetical protein
MSKAGAGAVDPDAPTGRLMEPAARRRARASVVVSA